MLRFFVPLLLCSVIYGQSSAELKAYSAAQREKDPAKKIELLTTFIKENSKSPMLRSARRDIVTAAIKAWPKDLAKIQEVAEAQANGGTALDQAYIYNAAASQLNEANLFPEQALRWAQAAVKLNGSGKSSGLGTALDTLGQIQLKAGLTEDAERSLTKALENSPSLGSAAAALSKIADAKGDSARALQYASQGFLVKPVADNRKVFAEQWKKSHGGTMDGSEAFLDQRYAEIFPPVMHPKPYTEKAKRTVLVEVHTGSGCPPCAGMDVALDAVMERYSREQVAILFFHQHIPRPDPMTNADTLARWKFVQGTGVPTVFIDGKKNSGGNSREFASSIYDRIDPVIKDRLGVASEAHLRLAASQSEGSVRIKAEVAQTSSPDLQLGVALVEKMLKYSGENGIRYHPMVVRSFVTLPLADKIEHAFDLAEVGARLKEHIDAFEKKDARHNPEGTFRFAEYRHEINAGNLAVVAFVEDSKTREVLQSAYLDLARKQ